MYRDRTNLYISYRQSYSHHPAKRPRFDNPPPNASSLPFGDDSTRGLLSSDPDFPDDTVIELDHLPPRFSEPQSTVSDLLVEIAQKSLRLDKLHAKHVLPGFDDTVSRSREEGEIERLTGEITGCFHDCSAEITKVERLARSGTDAEKVMAKNIQIMLAGRVQEASASFRKKQSAYLKKLRGLGGITTPLSDRSGSPNPLYLSSSNTLLEEESDVSYSQSTLQKQRQAHLTSNDGAIMQREKEITDIAQGIIELAGIFRELQSMVIDQGTLLDRIDYNVESMSTNVKAADKELIVASTTQKKTTKRKAILLLILVVVGLIIVLSVKPKHGVFSGGSGGGVLAPIKDDQDKDKGEKAGHIVDGGSGTGKGLEEVAEGGKGPRWERQRRRRRRRGHVRSWEG